MKKILIISLFLPLNIFHSIANDLFQDPDPSILIGTWLLDMSPEDKTDNNFAVMQIQKIKDNTFVGSFYREGVKIREGRFTTQGGKLFAALISGDNSGEYNSSFYYEDGKLYGTTHAIQRGFLSVWVATKEE